MCRGWNCFSLGFSIILYSIDLAGRVIEYDVKTPRPPEGSPRTLDTIYNMHMLTEGPHLHTPYKLVTAPKVKIRIWPGAVTWKIDSPSRLVLVFCSRTPIHLETYTDSPEDSPLPIPLVVYYFIGIGFRGAFPVWEKTEPINAAPRPLSPNFRIKVTKT